jgi:diketogulonate reductase-like aldo/keto reductase
VYGNEAELGLAIKQSGLPRSAFYITTKLPGTYPTDTAAHFAASLAKLQLDYVDLYLIHAPYFASSPSDLQQKWADLEALQSAGLARSIGVSNYLQPDLETVLSTAKVVPAVNQIEYHPYLQHAGLLDFHKAHGIATVAYGPLSAVLFARPGPLDQYYANLARKYGVQEAEVALRWCVQQDVVALTTSKDEGRMRTYLKNIGEWELSEREVNNIKEIGSEKHFRRFWNNKFAPDDRS